MICWVRSRCWIVCGLPLLFWLITFDCLFVLNVSQKWICCSIQKCHQPTSNDDSISYGIDWWMAANKALTHLFRVKMFACWLRAFFKICIINIGLVVTSNSSRKAKYVVSSTEPNHTYFYLNFPLNEEFFFSSLFVVLVVVVTESVLSVQKRALFISIKLSLLLIELNGFEIAV